MAFKRIACVFLLLCMMLSMFAMPTANAANVELAPTGAGTACIAGTFNGWSTTANTMTISSGMATGTINLSAGTYEFKIVYDDAWYGNGGQIQDTTAVTSSVGWEMWSDSSNCTLVAKGGTYVFQFNTSTHFLKILPQYSVTFKSDGSTLKTQNVLYGESATAPSNPTKAATAQYTYTFSKWDTAYTNVKSNLTVNAVFTSTVNKYTVAVKTNNSNYGTVSTAATSVAYGSTTTLTATPKTGYHLSSWSINNSSCSLSSTTALKPTLTVKGNVTATATFAANTGKVTFSAGTGGSVNSTGGNTTYSGTKAATATASTGYYFTGWSISGGTLNTDYKITSGSTSSASITIQPITQGATITCKANFGTQYKITTQQNWGVLGTVTKSTTYVTPGNTVTLTANPDSGNGYNKWTFPSGSFTYTSGSATSTTITIKPTSNITAQANFYAGLNVTAGSGGTVSPSGKHLYDYNKSVTITATPNAGYHFTGWTFGGGYSGSPSTSSASTTITVQDQTTAKANFAINTYTVTFKNWDGTVLATRTGVTHGTAATAPSNPTRPADAQYTYTFSGWDKAYNNVTSNLTVTAQYSTSVNKYTVTFNNWDGTPLSTQSVAYGSAATAPSNPTRGGDAQYSYTFSGWDKDFSNITGNLIVTAKYTQTLNKYTVKFVNWDGSTISSQSVEYGKAASSPSVPARSGYEFTGWDKDFSNITGNITVTAQFKYVSYFIAREFNS